MTRPQLILLGCFTSPHQIAQRFRRRIGNRRATGSFSTHTAFRRRPSPATESGAPSGPIRNSYGTSPARYFPARDCASLLNKSEDPAGLDQSSNLSGAETGSPFLDTRSVSRISGYAPTTGLPQRNPALAGIACARSHRPAAHAPALAPQARRIARISLWATIICACSAPDDSAANRLAAVERTRRCAPVSRRTVPAIGGDHRCCFRGKRILRHGSRTGCCDLAVVAPGRHLWSLSGFAKHLCRDEAAFPAALEQPWSNGPVEGYIHSLKLIKRSMYGRANFDLLRPRVLKAAIT